MRQFRCFVCDRWFFTREMATYHDCTEEDDIESVCTSCAIETERRLKLLNDETTT